MKRCLAFGFVLMTLLMSVGVVADELLKIDLKNRSAASLKAVLSKLVETDVNMIAAGNSLILSGKASTLKQLRKIALELDIAVVSLSVSIYRGVDPNVAKDRSGVNVWTTNKVSNRLDMVVIESGQRLMINETNLLVLPGASLDSRLNEGFDGIKSLDNSAWVARQMSSTFNRREIIITDTSLIVEPSLFSVREVNGKTDVLSEKIFVRYTVPVNPEAPDVDKNVQQGRSMTTRTQVVSQRVINPDEWVQLSGHQIVSYRPSLSANKKIVSTQELSDSDNNIWIKVNRLN
jgi:hypothetical protein